MKQVRWEGFLSALQLQKAQASSSNGQTCWGGPPSLGILTAHLQDTLPTAWPSSCMAPNL